MKKKIIILSLVCCLFLTTVFAHSGRTDASGGHRDNKNVSGGGYYHYHCGGNPPHLHSGGVCPYSVPKTTYKPLTTPSTVTSTVVSTPFVSVTPKTTVEKPSFPVKLNNLDISNFCAGWLPFIYKDIVYIPMTSAVMSELNLTSSFDGINGLNINKPSTLLQAPATEKSSFLDDYIVIVSAKDQTKYHKYGCYELDLSEFWAYNTELAKSYGYTACSKCN